MFNPIYKLNGEEGEFLSMISVENEGEDSSDGQSYPSDLPILAAKNIVLFPGIVLPITIGREKSILAIKEAYKNDRLIGVLTQKDMQAEDPKFQELHLVGTVARVIKLLKMPDGSYTAVLQGRRRFSALSLIQEEPYARANIQLMAYDSVSDELKFKALLSSIRDSAREIIDISPNIPKEANIMLQNIKQSSFLLNFIASNMNIPLKEKQSILEENDLVTKAESVLKNMNSELQMLRIKDQIEDKVRSDIDQQQRQYYLNQQLKTIQQELGQDPRAQEIEALEERAAKKKWSNYTKDKFEKELERLKRMNPQVAEYSIQLNYLDTILTLPWNEKTKDNFDLNRVQKKMDTDHYGLEKIKNRILEYLAVIKLKQDLKSPILCFVGPPGVGKTSLGRSIAEAIGRKYVRISLGGLHDESEIRGHRKTYIGAMPGRIIQSIKKAGTSNPVFILDEIDKVGSNFRGDPSSALLEVLDPEQNTSFYDNYLEMEYDLSNVMFIATANSLNTIQPALRDRMEIIDLSGYSTQEKVEIAKKHLIPKQREAHGLKSDQVKIAKRALVEMIDKYTRESGVRSLDRKIAALMRHRAKAVSMDEEFEISIKPEHLHEMLGPARFNNRIYQEDLAPGVAIGLAWTRVGGDILFIETALSQGKGRLQLTGNLGDVMKESASTALTWIKANAEELGISTDQFDKTNVHIHVPEGAIPKDGPSAGITMLSSLASAFTKRKIRRKTALTGEITLRGKILPVGGIKEKILAAKRAGIKTVVLCKENEKDVNEINEQYVKGMEFKYMDNMSELMKYILT